MAAGLKICYDIVYIPTHQKCKIGVNIVTQLYEESPKSSLVVKILAGIGIEHDDGQAGHYHASYVKGSIARIIRGNWLPFRLFRGMTSRRSTSRAPPFIRAITPARNNPNFVRLGV